MWEYAKSKIGKKKELLESKGYGEKGKVKKWEQIRTLGREATDNQSKEVTHKMKQRWCFRITNKLGNLKRQACSK